MKAAPVSNDIILRTGASIMVPVILLWGLYVLIHGAIGPGGGFQAGVILAAGFILYTTAFGLKEAKKILSVKLLMVIASTGLFIYAGVGMLAIIFGGNFLEYGVIPIGRTPAEASKYGIEMVELGIGLTVMSIMLSIFYDIALKEKGE
ncbi:MAG: Na(+)/H(+) antiporter subunit B [Candidatus Methanoperedens sp.]|jgi:multicomponent Na+:H+ antiporter subunit B|nr:Na(+)/H(+) antiporter subunit B [Candidatus Methanoperedens sp.]PKL54544.1 MAG: cation:proton antiporter [Candidatus Methanoperedenaceae archaeon HGW-Methanoperedenaceae-1]